MVPLRKIEVCSNDCMFFPTEDKTITQCTYCGEDRYREVDALGRKVSNRYFSYCTLKNSLTLLFRCSNIAQIMQEAGGSQCHILSDIKDSTVWSHWMAEDDVSGSAKIILGFNTDGRLYL